MYLLISFTAFAAAVEKAFQRQKKNISVPGFRKGKVTRAIVEKYYTEEAPHTVFVGEVVDIVEENTPSLSNNDIIRMISYKRKLFVAKRV